MGAVASYWAHGTQPLAGQFFCGDRTSGVLSVPCRARHRFLERSIIARAPVLVFGHAVIPPGLVEFSPDTRQCTAVPVRQSSARRSYANGATDRTRVLRTQYPGSGFPTRTTGDRLLQRGGGRNRRKEPDSGGELCRSLQPGTAILSQPKRLRTDASCRRFGL